MNTLTSKDRREIYAEQFGRTLSSFDPKGVGGRYSGAQVSRAKGIARQRASEIIDVKSPR